MVTSRPQPLSGFSIDLCGLIVINNPPFFSFLVLIPSLMNCLSPLSCVRLVFAAMALQILVVQAQQQPGLAPDRAAAQPPGAPPQAPARQQAPIVRQIEIQYAGP